MLLAAAEAVRPTERLTVSAAAAKYRKIRNPGSFIGDWDNSVAPYLVEIMDTLTSLQHEAVIFAGPARCGKSDMFQNWLTSTAICDPADMMVVHMTQSTARDWSQSDLAKALRHTPELGARLIPGKQNDNVYDKKFTTGMRLIVRWPSITELSGKTIPRCWLMDLDRMEDDVDGEGSPFALTIKRNETFGRFGMTVAESSPGREVMNAKWIRTSAHEAPPVSGGILPLYNRGDRRRFYWQCIECKGAFEPDFRYLDYPDSADAQEAAALATMKCPHCAHRYWHDPQKQGGEGPSKNEMNQLLAWGGHAVWLKDGEMLSPEGLITGTPARSKWASFWLKGAAACFSNWEKLVFNYLKAEEEYEKTGSEEALKTTVNVDQGNAYTPKTQANARLPETLKDRARELGLKKVPFGARALCAFVDVQKNRFIVQVHGVGVGGDTFVVDRFEIKKAANRVDADGDRDRVAPGSYIEDWKLLIPEVLEKTYELNDGSGRRMSLKYVFCDSGGSEGVTANAYDFVRFLRDDEDANIHYGRFRLLKGDPMRAQPRVQLRFPDSERKDRHAGARGEIAVLFINSNLVKDQLDHLLDRTTPGGGMIHFPEWLPDSFYVELTAEVRDPKGKWENPSKRRNESWDFLYYQLAVNAWSGMGIENVDWRSPPGWLEEWDDNDLVFMPEREPVPFKPKEDDMPDFAALAKKLA